MIMYIFSILSTGIVMQCMFLCHYLSVFNQYIQSCLLTLKITKMIKFTSCLPMVCGSLQVLGLPPTLKLVGFMFERSDVAFQRCRLEFSKNAMYLFSSSEGIHLVFGLLSPRSIQPI